MLIPESDLAASRGGDVFSMLESMDYLTEDESTYDAAMVPIVENSRIGANVVALEDIMEFCESNGIEDMGYAVSQICEASNVEPSTLAFSVQETSVIADADMAQLVSDVMSEGCNVLAVPPSPYDPLNEMAGMAVEACMNGDDSLLEAYANFDFYEFLDEATINNDKAGVINNLQNYITQYDSTGDKTLLKRIRAILGHYAGGRYAHVDPSKIVDEKGNIKSALKNAIMSTADIKADRASRSTRRRSRRLDAAQKAEDIANGVADTPAAPAAADAKTNTAGVTPEKIDEVVKDAEKKNPNFIARAIANLNRWAVKLKRNRTKPGVDHGIIDKIVAKIASAVAYLTKKLGAEKYRHQMNDYQAAQNK